MSNKEHRLGVSEINLVTRHLKLEPNDEVSIRAAVVDIDQLYGLDGVSFDEKKWRLDLAYDASRVCLDCVEDILKKHAVEISHDWWTRFKEEHYRFVDQNVKDNANHEPWSCHQSPPGSGKKK
ncbi:cation transporter [Halomonas sp. MCCC 1A17488]|uniref:cation transporter n=1 Tax=unclassified Halomonas TaxID=2609666 RepID=UPI0018D20457|nr:MULTISPECIES: cation transporter [unclassified Halomonas]MCE8015991.1 cation transporter [Halomonas sp. MCCC 1A17488]MCG3239324.1 cation transporter [Halomonas sp. MCCC 1A17488]QPP50745.1 cation transporter [Halomonas sp. SS10-MC5]